MTLKEIDKEITDTGIRTVYKCTDCNTIQFDNDICCTHCSIDVVNITGREITVLGSRIKPNQVFQAPKKAQEIKNLIKNKYLMPV